MATLKANGPELLRLSREENIEGDKSVTWRRKTVVCHTNGVILVKNDVRFRPMFTFDPPNGRFYSWGWKKSTAAKDNSKPVETAKNMLRKALNENSAMNWTVEFVAPEVQSNGAPLQ